MSRGVTDELAELVVRILKDTDRTNVLFAMNESGEVRIVYNKGEAEILEAQGYAPFYATSEIDFKPRMTEVKMKELIMEKTNEMIDFILAGPETGPKYELTQEIVYKGRKLYQIKALQDFANIHTGQLGGFIQNEQNLSHTGRSWLDETCKVYGEAKIEGDVRLSNQVVVSGESSLTGDVHIEGPIHLEGTMINNQGSFIRVKKEI